ncbi:MAG: zinc-binding dehydrogenase, partial [Microbacteriaceae bacterium]
LVHCLGADHVIDYCRDDFADGRHAYDLILDIGGNPMLSRLRRALTPTGTAVIVGGEGAGNWTTGINRQLRAMALSPFIHQRLTMLVSGQNSADLEQLADFIDAGTLTPTIDRTFALSEVPDAMRYLESGAVRGKLAIGIRSQQ